MGNSGLAASLACGYELLMTPETRSSREFTLDEYAALLDRTQAIYQFVGFEILAEAELPERFCILRHDIDMSPQGALRLAEIEAEKGARATYTILLTGPQYSPFEKLTLRLLRRIGELGHELALHFDASWHDISNEEMLHSALRSERRTLEELIEQPVRCFSFHNTTDFTMSARADSYGDLWNAYAGRLQDHVSYVSDSNGYWRFRSWADLLDERPSRLQVLTHPEWWGEESLLPAETVCRILDARSRTVWSEYVSLLRAGGRTIKSGVPDAQAVLLDQLGELELMRLWLSGEEEAAYLKILRAIAKKDGPLTGEHRKLLDRLFTGHHVAASELEDAFVAAVNEFASLSA